MNPGLECRPCPIHDKRAAGKTFMLAQTCAVAARIVRRGGKLDGKHLPLDMFGYRD